MFWLFVIISAGPIIFLMATISMSLKKDDYGPDAAVDHHLDLISEMSHKPPLKRLSGTVSETLSLATERRMTRKPVRTRFSTTFLRIFEILKIASRNLRFASCIRR